MVKIKTFKVKHFKIINLGVIHRFLGSLSPVTMIVLLSFLYFILYFIFPGFSYKFVYDICINWVKTYHLKISIYGDRMSLYWMTKPNWGYWIR